MPELPLTKAEDTTEDVMATVPTVLHITGIAMVAGITVTIMYTAASSAAIKAAAAGIDGGSHNKWLKTTIQIKAGAVHLILMGTEKPHGMKKLLG